MSISQAARLKPGIERGSRMAWNPPDHRPPWKWAEDNIIVDNTSPFPGKWKSETSPWVKEVMEVIADNTISDVSCICSSQSSKTQTFMNALGWVIDQDPGPAMWVMAAQDEAKTFSNTRLMPTLEKCKVLEDYFPKDRHSKTMSEIHFKNMPFILNGANSQSKLQSKPIRWLFLDEVRNYPPGALEMVLKRTRAFWNARRLIISTPDMVDDAVHRAFLSGDQRHYHVMCPKCEWRSPLKWEQMKWETDAITHPNESDWNFDALSKTIRYECIKCSNPILDRADQRKLLANSGIWIPHNPSAPKSKASFTWNAILPPWVKWRDLVEEFIRAKEAVKVGAIEPLKAFVNESLGEPWEETILEDAPQVHHGDYSKGEPWTEEAQRFLTVDKQKDHYWAIIRSWNKIGGSRLIWEGKIFTYEDIYDLQMKEGVTSRRVMIDSGYMATEVYEQCIKYGWTALKGEDKQHFIHVLPSGKRIAKLYSVLQRGDPGIGTREQGKKYAQLFLFSTNGCKDWLSRLRRGIGPKWELPKDISKEYIYQIDSETKKKRHHSRTGQEMWEWVRMGKRPNHLLDCEVMQIAGAIMSGIISRSELKPEEPVNS